MPEAVLLHHLNAESGDHYDWLLAPADGPYGPDERVLIAFRVDDRIDGVGAGADFEALRIADHRWLYLSYEGEIAGGRGRVERVARGIWRPRMIEAALITGEIEWGGRAPALFEGRRDESDHWRFQTSAPHRR